MNNIRKKKKTIILIQILLCATIFLLLLGITFSYFKKDAKTEGQIQLGELDFTIQTSKISQVIMPGDNIDLNSQIINKVSGKNKLIPFYFRFKLTDDENYEVIVNANDYILGNDNFYYCKQKLLPNASQQLFSSLKISENIQKAISLDVAIYVEAVQSEHQAYLEIFNNAPQEWIDFIENN